MKDKLLAISAALLLSLTGFGLVYSNSLYATDERVQSEASNAATATFDIQNMTCATCPITVSKAMSRVEGVEHVEIDFKSKTALVTYDPALVGTELIGEASTSIGYTATLIGRE